jgi:hypothetical protein
MAGWLYLNSPRVDSWINEHSDLAIPDHADKEKRAQLLWDHMAQSHELPDASAAASPGDCVKVDGIGYYLAKPDPSLNELPPGLVAFKGEIHPLLGARRAQARVVAEMGDPDTYRLFIFTSQGQRKIIAASIADSNYCFKPALASQGSGRWKAFGRVERVVDTVPLLALAYARLV